MSSHTEEHIMNVLYETFVKATGNGRDRIATLRTGP